MSAPKFTPGPWHYAGAGILMNDDGEEIALSPIYDDVPDGRLIAAAPEMYAALLEARKWLPMHRHMQAAADLMDRIDALAKAVGP